MQIPLKEYKGKWKRERVALDQTIYQQKYDEVEENYERVRAEYLMRLDGFGLFVGLLTALFCWFPLDKEMY